MAQGTANAERRTLSFKRLDEVLADAERLVASPGTRMLGSWPLGQLLAHLAVAINGSIDGIDVRAPLIYRVVGRLIRQRILTRQMRAGFTLGKKLEADFFPQVASPAAGLERLRSAIGRLEHERMTARHPVLGKLTHEQWTQLHLRHAELHLSFAVPE